MLLCHTAYPQDIFKLSKLLHHHKFHKATTVVESKAVKARIDTEVLGSAILYEDGTIHRTPPSILVPPTNGLFIEGLATKDIEISGRENKIPARIYMPEGKGEEKENNKLPVIIFFHGGGFCLGNPAAPPIHNLCSWMSINTGIVWVSVAYSLEPEHRLPEALEDATDVFKWLGSNSQLQPLTNGGGLLTTHADVSRCVVAGQSSGASLAYLLAVNCSLDDSATKILGTVLIHPGFLKPELSKSEVEYPPEKALMSLDIVENCLKMSLPEGADRGYFIMDPKVPDVTEVKLPPIFAVGGGLDIFIDRHVEFCHALEDAAQAIEFVVYEDMDHFSTDDTSPDAVDERRRTADFIRLICGG